jgi:hypothetical protein
VARPEGLPRLKFTQAAWKLGRWLDTAAKMSTGAGCPAKGPYLPRASVQAVQDS